MVWNSNLGHWLVGSRRGRELDDIRASWASTQAAWRCSPIGKIDPNDPIGALSLQINKESWERLGRAPGVPIAIAVGRCIADLLTEEQIGKFEPAWDVIDADVSVAVEFRQVIALRQRYATDFTRVHGIVSRSILEACDALYQALPQSVFERDEGSFEVPLVELVGDPAELVRKFLAITFRREVIDHDLFKNLRGQLRTNWLLASGLDPAQWNEDTASRLVKPSEQRGKTPAELADLYLAFTPFRELLDTPVPFRIAPEVRFAHGHIVGGTGHGKTQLLQRMIHADFVGAQTEKRSVVVIDSQGDLINKLVRLRLFDPEHPDSLADRLVLIDPADVEFPPALNLFDAHLDRLAAYRPVDRERLQNGVIELYENFFGDLLGAELTQKQGVVFKYLARLLLLIPGATLHTLIQLMEDPKPYMPYMGQLEGSARFFFETEFFDPSFTQTKRQIQRRLWGVLSTPAFERMFTQTRNKLDLFQALQDGKIVLISTAKDLLKQEGSQLFGRFFIGLLAQAILERSTLDPEERTPTLVYVDEAQEYFDDTIETILNQARKYRTGITLAHQTLDQLSPRLRAVLYANTSLKCAGGVSARDARALAEELHTSAEFVESMKRRDGQTEFAAWIKNQTPRAIRLAVPLGFLERQPILTEEAYDALLKRNRVRYCGTMADVEASLRSLRKEKPFGQATEATGKTRAVPPPTSVAVAEPERRGESPAPPPTTAPQLPPKPPQPTEPGKGGSQHRYVQQLVKRLAEARGLHAVIEEAVDGGHVDVGLHQGAVSIACEISVTSTAEYETRNLAKCLRAGFARVWAIAPDQKRRRAIEQLAKSKLSSEELAQVDFLTTEDLVEAIESLTVPEPEEKVVAGYKVKTTWKPGSPTEAKARRDAIARILADSLRRQEQGRSQV